MDWEWWLRLTQNNTFSHFCTVFLGCLIFPHGETYGNARPARIMTDEKSFYSFLV
jgi:hypothetical protein